MIIRTVEQSAPAQLAEYVTELSKLTTDQPTTAELEETLVASKAITRAVFEWLASRYSAQAAAGKTYETPIICSPELDAALDEWEERQNRVCPLVKETA